MQAAETSGSVWRRPASASDPQIWGHRDGLIFGVPSKGGMKGPRGLIRVGYWDAVNTATVVNFIAIEPVTSGTGTRFSRIGFSELEPSQMDAQKSGKRLWVDDYDGEITSPGMERLDVRIEVESFSESNNAHVYVVASMHVNRPDELQFSVHHHEDSPAIEELTLSATMGNYPRLRHLWLKDKVVDSRTLFAGFNGQDFVEKESYPLDRMLRLANGDAVAFATTNEANPQGVTVPNKLWWTYKLPTFTQYWRVPVDQIQSNLRTRVNGRRVYWMSETEVPGGISYENFEVRQAYVPGQVFVYGLTRKAPWELGPFSSKLPGRPKLD